MTWPWRESASRPKTELDIPPSFQTTAATASEIALRWAAPIVFIAALYAAFSLPF